MAFPSNDSEGFLNPQRSFFAELEEDERRRGAPTSQEDKEELLPKDTDPLALSNSPLRFRDAVRNSSADSLWASRPDKASYRNDFYTPETALPLPGQRRGDDKQPKQHVFRESTRTITGTPSFNNWIGPPTFQTEPFVSVVPEARSTYHERGVPVFRMNDPVPHLENQVLGSEAEERKQAAKMAKWMAALKLGMNENGPARLIADFLPPQPHALEYKAYVDTETYTRCPIKVDIGAHKTTILAQIELDQGKRVLPDGTVSLTAQPKAAALLFDVTAWTHYQPQPVWGEIKSENAIVATNEDMNVYMTLEPTLKRIGWRSMATGTHQPYGTMEEDAFNTLLKAVKRDKLYKPPDHYLWRKLRSNRFGW